MLFRFEFSKLLGLNKPTVEQLREAARNNRKNSGIGCDKCNYTGYCTLVSGYTGMCECMKESFLRDLFNKAGVPKKYIGKQINDWNTRTDDYGNDLGIFQSVSENVFKLMQAYERNFQSICNGNPPKLKISINIRTHLHSICFNGTNGSGKTFIAIVLVQTAIRKNLTAKYYDWTDILQLLTDFDKKKELDDLVEDFKKIGRAHV